MPTKYSNFYCISVLLIHILIIDAEITMCGFKFSSFYCDSHLSQWFPCVRACVRRARKRQFQGLFTLPPSVDGSHWLCMGRSRNALWVRPSIWLRGLRQKVEKCSTFHAAPDPSANQIAVMQMQSTRFLDPFCNNKQEEAVKIQPHIFLKKCGKIGLFLATCLCHLFYIHISPL